MKTIYNQTLSKKLILIAAGLCILLSAYSQVDKPGEAVWQWSTPVRGGFSSSGKPMAYLWIPENCTKLRGLVVAENNMEELHILENRQFRDSLKSIGFGEIWFSPAFSPYFNIQEGAGDLLLNTLSDLSDQSGYPELFYVPLAGIGHSAMANFAFELMTFSPERALCGVSISAVFPYDYGNDYARPNNCGNNIDYMPYLVCQGEMEGAGDLSNSIFNKSFFKRKNHPLTPITHLPAAGEWHFATSQKKTDFIAYYIKKAAFYRLLSDATASSYAVLTPIDPTATGWLYDRWIKNMRPRYPAAPVATYSGKRSITLSSGEENFWAFDEEMARKIEAYEMSHFRKTPCLIAYNQSSTAGVTGAQVPQNNNHVQCRLQFYPLNDSLDFELSSSFLDTIPAISGRCTNFMGTTPDTTTGAWVQGTVGARISHPANNSLSVIERELGPIAKLRTNAETGITTFRMTVERGNGSTNTVYNPIFSVSHPGDATFKASVLQADMWFSVRNTSGTAQSITFPAIADVSNTTGSITLNATSSAGLPVQYYIEEGPAKISGNKIIFTALPQNAKLPVKVTVTAWQWGRNTDMVNRLGGSLYQSAFPVSNTFYITGRMTPQSNLNISASRVSPAQLRVNWNTISVVNTAAFELERSLDNLNWTKISSLTVNQTPSSYYYDDNQPLAGTNYYRLKLISQDETFTYSAVVSATPGTTSFEMLNKLVEIRKLNNIMRISGFEPDTRLKLSVVDLSGRIISQTDATVSDAGIVETALPALITGVYVFNVVSDDICRSVRFIY